MAMRSFLILLLCCVVMACKPPAQSTAPQSVTLTVAEAQAALTNLGYRPGPVDGILGRRTRAELRAFQSRQGLQVTGELDTRTSTALAAAARGTGATPSNPPVTASRGAPVSAATRMIRRDFWPARLTEVDLNGDGMVDVIAQAEYQSGACGAYLCSHAILLNTGSGFRKVNDVLAAAIAPQNSRTRGYRNLALTGRAGDATATGIWRWKGSAYGL